MKKKEKKAKRNPLNSSKPMKKEERYRKKIMSPKAKKFSVFLDGFLPGFAVLESSMPVFSA